MTNDMCEQAVSANQDLNAKTLPDEWLNVESLDIEAQGIAHNHAGKVVFIEGALPGERAQVDVRRRKNQWESATARTIQRPNALRVSPHCPYFGLCGGCAMQHFHSHGQIAIKQRALEDNLWHLAKVKPDVILRPIEGPAWGYRWRARLSVRHVFKKGSVLIGFREKRSSYVADMLSCAVLPKDVSKLLPLLRELILSMDGCDRIPQIEVAVGEDVIALALRHLEPLTLDDKKRLVQFALAHEGGGRAIEWWLQPKGPETVHLLTLDGSEKVQSSLCYRLPEFDVTMPFKPSDFTQVNPFINRVMVHRAINFLEIQPHERIIDWFCGLGNFTLPLSRQAQSVVGVEGSTTLVARAQENAKLNGCINTDFIARNLFEMTSDELKTYGLADKWLLDPPREGALELVKALSDLHEQKMAGDVDAQKLQLPKRIVYVSCNPSTLARDAGLLVHQGGYTCRAAGVINMFPHTAHVESMAVFDYCA